MTKIKLNYTNNNSVANIILDNGKGNILDKIMMKDLHSLFGEFKNNKDIKLIIFEGEGKHFSFGASVPEHTKENAADMLSNFHGLFYEIIELSIPTMAKISGQCLGGGLELALICNFIFADKTARLGQPEILLGVFPPPASIILPQKIGNARAEELLITGKSISAEEAYKIGLVNSYFEDKNEMNESINKWIKKYIIPKSASSLKYAVRTSRIVMNKIIKEKLADLEKIYINELMETNDANEGINSFLEGRKPEWKNS